MNSCVYFSGEFELRYGQATDAGVKPKNKDSLGVRIPEDPAALSTKGIAAVIADGVSAAEAAREAADLCVLGFLNDFYSTPDTWQTKISGQRVLTALNRWLYSEGQGFRDASKGFVCAMSAVVVKGRQAHVFHVGDTRVWHFREGRIEPMTRDHAQQVSKTTTYLSRAMGLSLSLKIDYHVIDLRPGDALFLSTDGLHEHVSPKNIASGLSGVSDDPNAVCENLLKQALANGSEDNLSCQLLWLDRLPAPTGDDVLHELHRLPFPPDLDPGMKLEGWEVQQLLDASPRSQLYIVENVDTGQRAVMKTPSVNFQDDPAYIERFVLEEWVGRRIDTPHVVKIVAKTRPPQFLFHLLEFVDGQPLDEWAKAARTPEVTAVVSIIEQAVEGVRVLHRHEILHQDLKPANLMIGPDGFVKVIDFGSVSVAGIRELDAPFDRGRNLGTTRYAAPEYRLGSTASPRSDQFSLAVIAYELLTGKHPFGEAFEAANSPGDFAKLRYTPAFRHNPLVPVWIDGALRKATRLQPEGRYEVLSEFVADLRRPNPAFIRSARELPMIERNPVRFWQALCLILAIGWLITLVILMIR